MMRLTPDQQAAIRTAATEAFGGAVGVWLFGSRVDDDKRGGDIDLLIETQQPDVDVIVRAELAFLTKVKTKLGEQKIDLLIDYPTRQFTPPYFCNCPTNRHPVMIDDIPSLRLQEAWRECERHIYHLFHAMSSIRTFWPLTGKTSQETQRNLLIQPNEDRRQHRSFLRHAFRPRPITSLISAVSTRLNNAANQVNPKHGVSHEIEFRRHERY